MKRKQLGKLNIKSEKGFTMADLAIALIVFTIFTGIIGTFLYNIYEMNLQTKMSAEAVSYAIEILEDIDKIPYDEVQPSLASSYITKFSIPSGYTIYLEITNYNQGNDKEDLVKTVKLDVSYTLRNKTEKITINKLKVREL